MDKLNWVFFNIIMINDYDVYTTRIPILCVITYLIHHHETCINNVYLITYYKYAYVCYKCYNIMMIYYNNYFIDPNNNLFLFCCIKQILNIIMFTFYYCPILPVFSKFQWCVRICNPLPAWKMQNNKKIYYIFKYYYFYQI